jgi:integrase
MQYRIKKYAAECGLTDVHFHTLRHTFATRCIEVDFEIKSLSEILGHSSPRITLERYVHSSMELKRSNMNKLKVIGY